MRCGREVFFLSGSDENSLKNVLAAEREGITVQELVDRNVPYFEQLIAALGVDIDDFIRTSVSPDHIAGSTEIWRRMDEQGDIYSKDYEGLYCVGCEQFYAPAELAAGQCPEHLTPPDHVKERNYFFRLSRYGDRLLEELESGRLQVFPESRLNEVTSFIRSGLEDISVSRSVERARGWGIPVPGSDAQVMYVWIDALTNYINALGWTRGSQEYRRFWAGTDKRIHVVGKGVLRFHAVYWPAMLLSSGLPLPTEVVVHGYITAGGRKLSKSLGNADDPMDLVARYGQDAVRYYLLADFSPFGDGDFSEDRLVARHNTDLANGLGNLVSRLTAMTVRYRDGAVPPSGPLGEQEAALATQAQLSTEAVSAAMGRYDHREALARIWDLVPKANAYLDVRAPWHLDRAARHGDEEASAALDTVLHETYLTLCQLAILLRPFLPKAAAEILTTLGQDPGHPGPCRGSGWPAYRQGAATLPQARTRLSRRHDRSGRASLRTEPPVLSHPADGRQAHGARFRGSVRIAVGLPPRTRRTTPGTSRGQSSTSPATAPAPVILGGVSRPELERAARVAYGLVTSRRCASPAGAAR